MTVDDSTDDDQIAPAAAYVSHRSRVPLVWIVPTVAAIIGAWLAVHALTDHGPTITVTFSDADGIEAGKTKLRYQSVDIGDVKAITLARDKHTVDVTILTAKFAAPFLVTSTRFWIVRPRFGVSGVSGLGTLLSGAVIAMDVGSSKEPRREFAGLEAPPAVSGGARGKEFVLQSTDLGSLAISSPVYFHHIAVGQVSSIALNPDGHDITLKVFINSPYDQFVTTETRFWHASGVDIEVDSAGLHLQSQSLTTILAGGIAFEPLQSAEALLPAAVESRFNLAANRQTAMKPEDGHAEQYVLYFSESLRGLAPGAQVDFRGVTVGDVAKLNVSYDRAAEQFVFPVLINVYPERLWSRSATGPQSPRGTSHEMVARMVEHGFRAQLRTASLLTGQLYIALDFFPKSPQATTYPKLDPMPLPTIPGSLQQVQESLVSVAHKLDELPLGKIASDLDQTLISLNHALGKINADILPQAKSTLTQAQATLSETQQTLSPEAALQSDLRSTLSSVSSAADSIRVFVDYLDKHPESLIRGKTMEAK